MTREVGVGNRLDPRAGRADFGLDEVNGLTRRGGRVVRVEGAGVRTVGRLLAAAVLAGPAPGGAPARA